MEQKREESLQSRSWKGQISREEVERILIAVLSDYIVGQVTARLNGEKKKAVVLLTGALAGAEDIPEMLKALICRGWELKVALSRGAKVLFSMESLEQALPEHSIFSAGDIRELRGLIDERPFLLLPALTVNTAAKIAGCIADEPVSSGVAYAIGRGKQILACVDGCCPYRKARRPAGFYAPEAYQQQMNRNLTTLARYGIWLTDIKNLSDQAEKRFAAFIRKGGGKEQMSPGDMRDLRGIRIIGKEYVMECSPGTKILTAAEAVIPQVAADEIRRRGIQLIKG